MVSQISDSSSRACNLEASGGKDFCWRKVKNAELVDTLIAKYSELDFKRMVALYNLAKFLDLPFLDWVTTKANEIVFKRHVINEAAYIPKPFRKSFLIDLVIYLKREIGSMK